MITLLSADHDDDHWTMVWAMRPGRDNLRDPRKWLALRGSPFPDRNSANAAVTKLLNWQANTQWSCQRGTADGSVFKITWTENSEPMAAWNVGTTAIARQWVSIFHGYSNLRYWRGHLTPVNYFTL
jgi:hypothetical protein